MDAATQSRMFDPFFTTKEGGHGLGLAAALGVIRAHGGTIHVESALGVGTPADVVLPPMAPSTPVGGPTSVGQGA